MRIAVYGGSFNPPHPAHVRAARLACEALEPDKMLIIPAADPPHKRLAEGSPAPEERFELTMLAFRGFPGAEVSDMEISRGGASYTVDTLRALHARGETDLYLIVGTDMLLSFDRIWRAPDEIAQLCTLAVCARMQDDWDRLRRKAELLRHSLHAKIELVQGDSIPISSTELRQGGALRRYTAPAVADYIEQHHLYGY